MFKVKFIWSLVIGLLVLESINCAADINPDKPSTKDDQKKDVKPLKSIRTKRNKRQATATSTTASTTSGNSNIHDLLNTCRVGDIQPIFDKTIIIETFCRCPSGTYGFNCDENFVNPCTQSGAQFFAADTRIPSNYFIHCIDNLPFLKKCPSRLVWNPSISTCDFEFINKVDIPKFYTAFSQSGILNAGDGYSATNAPVVSTVDSPKASSYSSPTPTVTANYGATLQSFGAAATPADTAASQPSTPAAAANSQYSSAVQQATQTIQKLALLDALRKFGLSDSSLIHTLSASYRQMAAAPETPRPESQLVNTCSIGYVQPVWEGSVISGTYCRCPDNGYGFSCTENFANPCDGSLRYSPADSRLPRNYFVHCNWNIPYLNVCPSNLVWSQAKQSCDHDDQFYAAHAYAAENFKPQPTISYQTASSYGQQMIVPSISQQPIVSTTYNQQQMPIINTYSQPAPIASATYGAAPIVSIPSVASSYSYSAAPVSPYSAPVSSSYMPASLPQAVNSFVPTVSAYSSPLPIMKMNQGY